MKMSDVFNLPLEINRSGDMIFESLVSQTFAVKAINNHDRLTEENAKLRQMLKYAVKVANDQNATYTAIEILNNEVQQLLNQLEQKQ